MNNRSESSVVKNISTAFAANMITLLVGGLLTLVLPKFISITEFSYYQLYVFYAGYVGFFGFGWLDGMYLRLGGQYYDQLDKASIHGQLRVFTLADIACSLAIGIFALMTADANKALVYLFFAVCIVAYMPRGVIQNVLMATNRIDEYATGIIINKTVQIGLAAVGVLAGQSRSTWFMAADIIGRLCESCYAFYICRDILKTRPSSLAVIKYEAKENISCGAILMISNIMSGFIIGIVRQGISMAWSVEMFGKVSLTLSISNMLMSFINSVSMVMFPHLKRHSESNILSTYGKMRGMLMFTMLSFLMLYYPARIVIGAWLPQYTESIRYMAMLFATCVYEGKMAMLVVTYMKALRREKDMLRYNVVTVIASLVLTWVGCWLLRDLDFTVFSIVLLLAFRSTIAEISLARTMGWNPARDLICELVVTMIFVAANYLLGGIAGMIIYAAAYVLYAIVNKKDIEMMLQYVGCHFMKKQ